jgi:hypothetical protein
MKRLHHVFDILLVLVFYIPFFSGVTFAWEIPTHIAISAKATGISSINDRFENSLGFPQGNPDGPSGR